MRRQIPLLCLLVLALGATIAESAEFRIVEAPSLGAAVPRLDTISFHELRNDDSDNPAGLISFEAWAETRPLQKKLLSPYPAYVEPMADIVEEGVTRTIKEKLRMYVAEARFIVSRPPDEIDLARYANANFLERLDPAIEHRQIEPGEADRAANKNPDRAWCAKAPNVTCIASKYRLEGKLPMAVQLVRQLTDDDKLSEYLEFQSELRILEPAALDQDGLKEMTGIAAPVAGAIEQTIFSVNQIMKFGKFLAVFQEDTSNPEQTIVTAYVALGLKARLLDQAKKYENVPILRNLVPAMVLTGKSSFNAGNSISAGLPVFARNNVKAVASLLEGQRPTCPSCFPLEACDTVVAAFFDLPTEQKAKPLAASFKAAELGPDLLQPCRPRRDPFTKSETCNHRSSLLRQAGSPQSCQSSSKASTIVAAPQACP